MIPVRLTLQGIYSYQNTPQTIEFGPLLDAGTFGIFGAVGSGKSTILEAITMALYGETERLNKRDDRNYNMMNLKSDRLIVEFEFRNYEGVMYRFECDGRRNSKQFNEVNTYRRRASVWENEEWTPLDHANGEVVTGISYDNFKRTVIVPQGHFQEFLELTPGARSQMLQDLFSLDRYDLSGPTGKLVDQNSESIHRLEGKLSGYEEVTVQTIAQAQANVMQWKEQTSTKTAALNQLRQNAETSFALKQLFDLRKDRQKSYDELIENEEAIHKSRMQLQMYQEARENFAIRFTQLDAMRQSVSKLENELQTLTVNEQRLRKDRDQILQQYQVLQRQVDHHETEQTKAREYAMAGKLLQLLKELEHSQVRIEKGMAVVDEMKYGIAAKEKETAKLETEMGQLREKTGDRELLVELKNLFERNTELGTQIRKLQDKMAKSEQKVKEDIALFAKNYQLDIRSGTDLPDTSILDARLAVVVMKIEEQRKAMHQLDVQSELAQFVAQLSSGEPCPLCGSTEHPAPAHIAIARSQIDEVRQQIEHLEREQKIIEEGKIEWKNLIKNMRERSGHRLQEEKEIQRLNGTQEKVDAVLRAHINKYPDITEVEKSLAESNQVMESVENASQRLKAVRQQWKADSDKLENYRKKIEEIKSVGDLLKGEVKSLESGLPDEIRLELDRYTIPEWQDRSVQLNQRIEKEKKEYYLVTKDRDRVLGEYTQLETKIRGLESYLKKEKEQLGTVESSLTSLLVKSSFQSFDAIREILDVDINPEQEKKRIQDYERQVHVLEVFLKDLETQIDGRHFDENIHVKLVGQLEVDEKELEKIRERLVYQAKKLEESEKRLKEKKNLEEDYGVLQIRAENLKVLEGLFRGKKFVDYVSTVYLREICEIANRRFRKLTNNHFSLVLGEDNQFNVRDYLHDGQTRSVKTLSGGQIFQVSLCLALALAESIQNRSKSRQNFFFLDEGFGTLDGDALRLVLEALKSLRQEDRVVGVISHVESLQDEMEMYLHIYNDPEKGSQIRKSWEMNAF